MKPAILLVGTVALAACAGNQSEVGAPPRALAQAPSVEVGPREVIATFPRTVGSELSWPAAHRASSWDTDQWRLIIPLGSGWLVAVHQVDVDSSLMAIARSSTEAAVGAGHLLGCDLGTHVLACGEPLAGSVTVVNGEVVMRIRSPEWRNTLRVQRPRSARLLFVRGGQEVLWEGLIDIDYDDRGHGV